jgi:hypothetical protein
MAMRELGRIGEVGKGILGPDGMIVCVPVPGDALLSDSPSVIPGGLSPATRRNDEVQKFRD